MKSVRFASYFSCLLLAALNEDHFLWVCLLCCHLLGYLSLQFHILLVFRLLLINRVWTEKQIQRNKSVMQIKSELQKVNVMVKLSKTGQVLGLYSLEFSCLVLVFHFTFPLEFHM